MADLLATKWFVLFVLVLFVRDSQGIDGELIAEGFIVIDAKALDVYMYEENNDKTKAEESLLEDVEFFFTDANEYFKSLQKYGINIKVAILDIQLMDGVLYFSSDVQNDNEVKEALAIRKFEDFLRSSDADLAPGNYDFAMLLTGFRLLGPIAGVANKDAICTALSASVVEMKGLFQDVGTIVHEIGHLLGSPHDRDDEPYIMAPSNILERDLRIFTFSENSARNISSNLQYDYHIRCLREKKPNSRIADVTPGKYKGKLQDPETSCIRAEGPGSGVCVNPDFYEKRVPVSGDPVCWQLKCLSPKLANNVCNGHYTTDGTACANGKACRKGKCEASNTQLAKNANTDCLFGDDVKPFGDDRTCQGYVNFFGAKGCPDVLDRCCGTCGSVGTGNPDCPYGQEKQIYDQMGKPSTCEKVEAELGKRTLCLIYKKQCCEIC